ncbi:Peptidoglycan-associated lipoprotein [Roseobacter fucihabitans]|uniref:Peptidoglycan-associated lipoprotein n=1 Tax=Roseobacter fucihabitans TaxID=1537242 RepID=A0ABZ2BRB6_9RHOB|nr:OmpA family protein [Roseobacter litoralis]MBC6966646.1 Outer membrane protein A precursor [Roseobacter litoralis]
MLCRFFATLLLTISMSLPMVALAQDVGTINFKFDADQLDAQGLAQVAQIAEQLKARQSYKPTVVVGFTDAVGTTGYNDGLGLRRAQSVAAALQAQGVPVDRIGSIASRGERELLVSVTGAERANRRVTVSLEEIMSACRSYREIPLTPASIGEELQTDLRVRLAEAVQSFDQMAITRRDGAAFQMAGAAREDCGIAVGYDADAVRKTEYAQKCFCSSARMQAALR